jgi:Heterokaryon incompatibility protein (HET)
MYSRLDHKKREIRLLSLRSENLYKPLIECDLETFELGNAPPFVALSYVWGDPNVTVEIQLLGVPKRITTNLFAALTRLRERNLSQRIWIDALCINQDDTFEKSFQVPLMRQIYRSADEVLSWLGKDDGETHLAFALLERWADAILSTSPNLDNWPIGKQIRGAVATIERPFDEQEWSAVKSLFQRSYWERIWIVQEIALARRCILICGRYEIMFEKVLWVHRAWIGGDLRMARLEEAITDATYPERFNDFMTIIRDQIDSQLHRNLKKNEGSPIARAIAAFPFLLKRASSLSATDARDKIYGLIGLLDVETPPIQVDYGKSAADVYTSAVSLMIKATKRLDILTFGRIGSITNKTAKEGLPSWVPDFERNDLTIQISEDMPFHNSLFFNASGKTKAECSINSSTKHISIKGILCDDIVAAITPCADHGERFRKWLAFILLHQPSLNGRQTSVQQAFFRAIIQDHLWRGLDGIQFLGSHLELSYFQMVAGFLTAVRCVYEDKYLASFDSELEFPLRTQLDAETKLTLATWFHNPSWEQEEDYHSHAAPEVQRFLGHPRSPSRLQWPESLSSSSEENGESNLVFFYAAMCHTKSRSLFVTRKGYIGVGCQSIEVGDDILVPFGCSVPLTVRKFGKNFKVVGDAYVSGIMQGELVRDGYDSSLVDEIVLE